jgi:hypothetical protein
MTNQHPLTDEICKRIAEDNVAWHPDWPVLDPMEKTCMRASYDMGREKGHDEMLNEVISWIKENSYKYVEEDPYTEDHEFNHSKFAAHLRKAMYPFPKEDS